jgi:3-deoxy-manno-octulosonate cytidylyltransferase (CMP-KDO synthetase)
MTNTQMQIAPRIVGVIPARLASTRLPRKVLIPIAGKPMLVWVYEAALNAGVLDELIVATDSEEVVELGRARAWDVRMTSADLQSGSDRVHAVLLQENADIYVNIQGDEPLLRPQHIVSVVERMKDERVMVGTLSTPCDPEQIANPNVVKVVTDSHGRALYFSRSAIPYDRDSTGSVAYQKHLGIYAYRKEALDRFTTLPLSPLEAAERLEQLRFLSAGIDIYVASTPFDTIGVDTEEDRLAVEAILRQREAI